MTVAWQRRVFFIWLASRNFWNFRLFGVILFVGGICIVLKLGL